MKRGAKGSEMDLGDGKDGKAGQIRGSRQRGWGGETFVGVGGGGMEVSGRKTRSFDSANDSFPGRGSPSKWSERTNAFSALSGEHRQDSARSVITQTLTELKPASQSQSSPVQERRETLTRGGLNALKQLRAAGVAGALALNKVARARKVGELFDAMSDEGKSVGVCTSMLV